MKYGLGIDTGGTYTDAVIFDFDENRILCTGKSLTVKEDLATGIRNVLDKLPKEYFSDLKLVSLSTTLATNACVEGKGARVALVFMGCDENTVAQYGREYGLDEAEVMIFIEGGHNLQGEVVKVPDWTILKEKVQSQASKVDSFVVTQMWGTRNPEFEIMAKELIGQWTGKPVLCAHELIGELNFLKRAATALLNARLIPIINEFIDAVKYSLKEHNITAPIVIVRGDGSMMSEEFARSKPIATLLSGPASSVAGGMMLSGIKDCVVVDMGGTTSDIAVIRNGRVKLANEGMRVGNWKIGTQAIDMKTVGLGGDSRIYANKNRELTIGPQRVAPISWLAEKWPEVLGELEEVDRLYRKHTRWLYDFFYLIKDISADTSYNDYDRRIASRLLKGPVSLPELADHVKRSVYDFEINNLEKNGIVMRSSLTPTDIMHLTGSFKPWSCEAALICAKAMAERLGMSLEEFMEAVEVKVKKSLYLNIVKLLIEEGDSDILGENLGKQAENLIMMGYRDENTISKSPGRFQKISVSYTTESCLVGLGAPTHIYLPDVAKNLGTRCVIPENASVANAVGAITGNITVEECVWVNPKFNVLGIIGYSCHSQTERTEFKLYEDAVLWAKKQAAQLAEEKAVARGAGKVSVTVEVSEKTISLNDSYPVSGDDHHEKNEPAFNVNSDLLLETVVTAYASGRVKWL